ncbi:hypothetical protein SUGI_1196680 [Cryptomeria japonica]|nr:hypothetical protein SUGI_1196680 [Cryptomeria japonica]
MERELAERRSLGTVGVVAEAFKILCSAPKLLGAITLTLLLPLKLIVTFGNNLIPKPLFEINENELLHQFEKGTYSLEKETVHTLYVEFWKFFLFENANKFFVSTLSLLSTAMVVYTVASIYTRKELSYTRVMSVVRRVWKHLMVTFLWYFIAMFVFYAAILFAFFWWIFTIEIKDFNIWRFLFGFLAIFIISIIVRTYIDMVWEVANVVFVLEENWGFGVMKKSRDLIKGKRDTTLALNILYLLIMGGIEGYFQYGVVQGRDE